MEAWMKNPDPDGLFRLREAIVSQAVKDWRSAKWVLTMHPDNIGAEHMRIDCENFFLSQHFFAITGLNGGRVLDKLEEDFNDDCKANQVHP